MYGKILFWIIFLILGQVNLVMGQPKGVYVSEFPVIENTQLQPLTPSCVYQAVKSVNLPFSVVLAVAKTEGGWVGLARQNTNGSFDLGVMQINSRNPILKFFIKKYNLTYEDVQFDGCLNFMIGVNILRYEIDRASSIWDGIAHYHSRTLKYKSMYLRKVIKNFKIISKNPGRELENILNNANKLFLRAENGK